MTIHAQIKRRQYDMLGRVLIGSLIVIAAALILFSGTLPSSAGSPSADVLATPKATATPRGPELAEMEATFTVGDIGQFASLPSVAVQRVEQDGTVVILDEGFEGDWPPPGWVAQLNWGASTCRAFAGSKSAWVEGSAGLACGSDYYNNENAFLIYGPFSLADATAASFTYQLWLNTYGGDYLCPMASLNGFDFYGICWYGTSNGWVEESLDLTGVPMLGNLAGQPAVWIALVWSTNDSLVKPEGAFFDEVQVTKTVGGPTVTPTYTHTPTRTPTVTRTPTLTPTPLPTPGWWWQIETVYDWAATACTSIALDSDGHPHISFSDGFTLKLASWDGNAWHVETVDSELWPGEYSSLVLDGADHPHIAYYDAFTNDDLKYAYWDGSTWQKETVESEGDVGKHTSLALDKDGYPHISYYDDTNDNLKYAYQDASGWHIETVDSKGWVGEYSSLALDESGYPHISYFDHTNYNLKYAYQDAAGWHIETVDSEGSVGYYTSLALDAGGNPHISYSSSPTCDLKYAHWDGGVWNIETVDSAGSCSPYYFLSNSSLALDGAAHPHIGYYNPNQEALWYARKDETTWHTEIVEGGDVGQGNSLALNAAGRPLISYVDDASGDLKLARWLDAPPTPTPTSTPTPTPVPPGQAQSYAPELAPAAGGGAIVVWYDDRYGPYNDVVFAHRFGSDGNPVWLTDVRVSAGPGTYDEMYPAIATDDDGNSFVVWQSGGYIYAQKLNSNGNHLWNADMVVYGWPSNAEKPRISLDQLGNWYVLWRTYWDACYGGPCPTIQLMKSGPGAWDEVRIVHRPGYDLELAVTSNGESRLVWREWQTYYGDFNIFGLSIDADGYRRWPNPVRINSDTGTAPQTRPRVAVNAAGDTYFVWADDKRNGNWDIYWDIYAQKFDVNVGHRLWANDVRVNSDAMSVPQTEPDLTIDTDGYVYVVWTDKRNGVADIYMQKLKPDGSRAWSPDLRINATSPADARSNPVVTVDPNGILYIAWESKLGNQHDIFMQSYTADGTRRWAADVVVEGQPPAPPPTSTPTLTPTATSTPTVTATPTPTATPVQPWMAWADPDTPLFVGPHGRQVTVNYGNIPTPATLAATLSGPVVFADDSQGLTANITDANGSYTLHLKPAAGATHGDTFTLEVTLAGLRLERAGTIAWEVYLPLILKRAP